MARRPKRFKLPQSFKIGNLIFIIIAGGIVFSAIGHLRSFIAASPYFKISKVEILLIGRAPLTDRTISGLLNIQKGENIFDADLKGTRSYILANYPEVRTLVINRIFPNKLILKIRPRRPVVQASLGLGFYLIDREAVILPGAKKLIQEDLPIINGLDQGLITNHVGKRCDSAALKKALRLLEVMNQSGFSQRHQIHMIDVSDERNLSLYIEGGIEIKIGGEDFRKRLSILEKTFEMGRLDKAQVRYIDLRFDNVIIGPR